MRVPSALNAIDSTAFVCPLMIAIGRPVAVSQRRTLLSGYGDPEARRAPSGLNATTPGLTEWPRKTATSRPVAPSQRWMVFSFSPEDAIRLPSGLTAT